jgi:hypothetical protein
MVTQVTSQFEAFVSSLSRHVPVESVATRVHITERENRSYRSDWVGKKKTDFPRFQPAQPTLEKKSRITLGFAGIPSRVPTSERTN